MTKHTPGPWRFATKSNFGNLIEADSGKRGGIGAGLPDEGYRTVAMYQACCASERYDDQEENRLANGHLIAAAPDLLSAAKLALSNLRRNLASEEACGHPFMGDDEHEAITVLTAAIAKATGEQP